MLKTVGTGIAVKNAVMELKEVNNLICDNIHNNGIKKYYLKYLDKDIDNYKIIMS